MARFDDRLIPTHAPGKPRPDAPPATIDLTTHLVPLPFGYRPQDVAIPMRETSNVAEHLFLLSGERRDLIYAPLRRRVVAVPRNGASAFEWREDVAQAVGALASAPEVDLWALESRLNPAGNDPTEAVFIPSEACNLSCVYCYSSAKARGAQLELATALNAIEACARAVKRQGLPVLNLRFLGGGEPTLAWDLVTTTVKRLRELAREIGVRSHAALVTNGTTSDAHAQWCGENFDEIQVSLDGPPDVQNRNRPLASGGASYDRTARTLHILMKSRAAIDVRSTVVEQDIERMPSFVRFLHEEFGIKRVCLEPVSVCGRAAVNRVAPPPPLAFRDAFLAARAEGRKHGMDIEYSSAVLRRLQVKFCTTMGRQFGLTPDGSITACSEVHSSTDERAKLTVIGRMSEGAAEIDHSKLNVLRSRTVDNIPTCSTCFAKFHCAGGCPMRSWRDGEGFFGAFESMCRTVRALLQDELEHIVDGAQPRALEVREGARRTEAAAS